MQPLSQDKYSGPGNITYAINRSKPKFLLKLQATQDLETPLSSPRKYKENAKASIETKTFKRAHKWDMTPSVAVLSEDDDYGRSKNA